jgi:hypothetical protein
MKMSLTRPTRPTRREWHRSPSRQAGWGWRADWLFAVPPQDRSCPVHGPRLQARRYHAALSARKYAHPRTTPPGPWLASEPHEGANPHQRRLANRSSGRRARRTSSQKSVRVRPQISLKVSLHWCSLWHSKAHCCLESLGELPMVRTRRLSRPTLVALTLASVAAFTVSGGVRWPLIGAALMWLGVAAVAKTTALPAEADGRRLA